MENRDVHAPQFLLNIETFRRFNVFEVTAAKGRPAQRRDHIG